MIPRQRNIIQILRSFAQSRCYSCTTNPVSKRCSTVSECWMLFKHCSDIMRRGICRFTNVRDIRGPSLSGESTSIIQCELESGPVLMTELYLLASLKFNSEYLISGRLRSVFTDSSYPIRSYWSNTGTFCHGSALGGQSYFRHRVSLKQYSVYLFRK